MASKKKTLKGKRYTSDEKQAIIDFVKQYNAEHGRGGATAASKQFGASQLSIGSWLKNSGGTEEVAAKTKVKGTPGAGKRGSALAELAKLDSVIVAKRRELEALESKFQKLKGSL